MIIPRETGNIPVTISTSNALESLFAEDKKYNNEVLWLNLRTIFRNLINSINFEVDFDIEMLVSDMLEEINIISIFLAENNVKGKNKVILYANSHNKLTKALPNAKVKLPKTEKQIQYHNFEKGVLESITNLLDTNDDYSLKTGDYKLEGKDKKAIVLTHQPIDLLSRYKFSDLTLLESHTGNLKRQSQWNSKLTGGSNLSRIPFNALTLQIFGDNSTNFYSYSVVYKKVLMDLAKKANWNALTGTDKLLNDLVQVKIDNPIVYDLYQKIVTKKLYF